MKRFTATEKWGKEWYQTLKPRLKCLWSFICDHADACGAWEPNFGLASYQIGEPVTEADLQCFGDRIARLENGKFFIVSFVEFQYGKLSETCPAHKPVLRALEKNRVTLPYQYPNATLSIPYQYPSPRVQEEEEEEVNTEGSAEGGEPTTETQPEQPAAMPEDERMLRALYRKRDNTPLSSKERKALEPLQPIDLDDLLLVVRYTEAQREIPEGKGWHRRDLVTLLNNFSTELDRARQWAETQAEPKRIAYFQSPNPDALLPMSEILRADFATSLSERVAAGDDSAQSLLTLLQNAR